jgi:hypothetical protein
VSAAAVKYRVAIVYAADERMVDGISRVLSCSRLYATRLFPASAVDLPSGNVMRWLECCKCVQVIRIQARCDAILSSANDDAVPLLRNDCWLLRRSPLDLRQLVCCPFPGLIQGTWILYDPGPGDSAAIALDLSC